jgi:hypothetical protein
MGLNVALKDRARAVVAEPSPTKVAGETIFADDIRLPWFRCRISSDEERKGRNGAQVERATGRHTLMFGKRDSEGTSLTNDDGGCVLRAQDRVEVESNSYGTHIYQLDSTPKPIRKKKTILGWTVSITRVDSLPFERKWP